MPKATLYIVCILFLTNPNSLFSQRKCLFSGNFTNVSFKSLVDSIKVKTGYNIYYQPGELDTMKVTVNANNSSITDLLKNVFANTSFHFLINSQSVYITRNIILQPHLADNFFNYDLVVNDTNTHDNSRVNLNQPVKKIKSGQQYEVTIIGRKDKPGNNNKAVVSGYVRDIKNGEPISGAAVFIDSLALGTTSDQFGYYSLTTPVGRYTLQVNSVGMKSIGQPIMVYSDGRFDIDLEDRVATLKDVLVTTQKKSALRSLRMGLNNLSIKTIKQIPVVFGEADIMKVATTLAASNHRRRSQLWL